MQRNVKENICTILSKQKFLNNQIFILGSCSLNQECVPMTKCPFTKLLDMAIKVSSNEDDKKAVQQLIDSKNCGDPSAGTICCDSQRSKL